MVGFALAALFCCVFWFVGYWLCFACLGSCICLYCALLVEDKFAVIVEGGPMDTLQKEFRGARTKWAASIRHLM